jgi:hypothetical protein
VERSSEGGYTKESKDRVGIDTRVVLVQVERRLEKVLL